MSLHLVSPSDAAAYEIGEDTEIGWWEVLPGEANIARPPLELRRDHRGCPPHLSQMRARALGEGETARRLVWLPDGRTLTA